MADKGDQECLCVGGGAGGVAILNRPGSIKEVCSPKATNVCVVGVGQGRGLAQCCLDCSLPVWGSHARAGETGPE